MLLADPRSSTDWFIIEGAHYTAKFARLVRDPRLRDDIQRTFDEDIARNPYECEEVFGTRLRALTIAYFPPLTIVFQLTKQIESSSFLTLTDSRDDETHNFHWSKPVSLHPVKLDDILRAVLAHPRCS